MSATKEHLHDQIEAGQRGKQHPIGWLNMPGYKPETWNPIVGCSKVSPGCDNCYAERMANRLTGIQATKDNYSPVISNGKWNGNTSACLNQWNWPLVWKAPRMVFVCSMGDLFHESVSFETIEQIYDMMLANDQHIFIVLTKRPERMYEFWDWLLRKTGGVGIQDVCLKSKNNIWQGVTAENQEQANKRIPILLSIPAAKRFVSIEPMLGPVDLTKIPAKCWGEEYDDLYNGLSLSSLDGGKDTSTPWHLDWVICGGESGSKARPVHPAWVRSVRDQCKATGTPFFFKQWGEWIPVATVNGHQYLPLGDYEPDTKFGFRRKRKQYATDILYGKQDHEWPQQKCKIASAACVYHACMDDGCQKQHMLKNGYHGTGDCEKPQKINL